MARKLIPLVILLLALVPVQAQIAIQPGVPVLGEITADSPQVTFLYNASAVETIRVETGSITPELAVQFIITDQNGALVQATGNPSLEPSLASDVALAAPGIYAIQVATVNNTTGQFVLQVSVINTAPLPSAARDCPTMVNEVITLVGTACADTGRNQACYGNFQVDAQPRAEVVDFSFANQGDREDLIAFQTLRTSPLDVANGQWGVTLMKLQANLPDTLPGQNVTMLIFGNVEIENRGGSEAAATLSGLVLANANLREGPGMDYIAVTTVAVGTEIVADGRLADNTWLRVRLNDGREGWMSTTGVAVSGDVNTLPVVGPGESGGGFGPMQAFYFRSGVGDLACQEAPVDGIMIQTPEGVGRIQLRINEVDVQLGSTAFITSVPGDVMEVSSLEGTAQVTAMGSTQIATAGMWVGVPINEDAQPVGQPRPPTPIVRSMIGTPPISLLPEQFMLPEISDEEMMGMEGDDMGMESEMTLPMLPMDGPCVIATQNTTPINVRRGPGLDFDVFASLNPELIYNVAGRNLDASWYQVADTLGWVAASVTRTGGMCGDLPVNYVPPTDEPAATLMPVPTGTVQPLPMPTQGSIGPQIAGDNEYRGVQVDYEGSPVYLTGAISYPQGDTQDTITYEWINLPDYYEQYDARFRYSITCAGVGVENAVMLFLGSEGGVPCSTTPYNFEQYLYDDVPTSGSITIALRGGDNAYITWNVTLSFYRPGRIG